MTKACVAPVVDRGELLSTLLDEGVGVRPARSPMRSQGQRGAVGSVAIVMS